jgi:NitT/TauT family transport system permease protein
LRQKAVGYAVAVALLLGGWELLALAVGSPALPGPAAALADFARLFPSELARHLAVSARRVCLSLAAGTLLAAPLGLLVGRSPRIDAVAGPLLFLLYPIPKVVLLPVLLVLLGIGDLSKIALITLIVFFQILVTARDAARAIPAQAVLSVRSLGANRWQVVRHVVLPAALPDIFTALRIGSGTAIAVLFFSESIAGSSGLGYFILDAWGRIAYSEMFAGILAMALLGVAIYELLQLLEARLCRWTRAGT